MGEGVSHDGKGTDLTTVSNDATVTGVTIVPCVNGTELGWETGAIGPGDTFHLVDAPLLSIIAYSLSVETG